MQVEVVERVHDLERLVPEWDGLWSEVPGMDIFSSAGWVSNWWMHFGRPGKSIALATHADGEPVELAGRVMSLFVLLVRERGVLIAVAPFMIVRSRWRRLPIRILALPINPHAPRSGIIVRHAPQLVLVTMLRRLLSCGSWDLLLIDGVPSRNAIVPRLHEAAAREGCAGRREPPWSHGRLKIEGTWKDFLARKGGHFRKILRQKECALAELGPVTVERYETVDEVERGFGLYMEIERESWKASIGESLPFHPALGDYYRSLLLRFADRKQSRVWILRIGRDPVAGYLCLDDGRTVYTLKTSYKRTFASARYQPGVTLLAHIAQDAWHGGKEAIDFVGRLPFVDRWASEFQAFDQALLFKDSAYANAAWMVERSIRVGARVRNAVARWVKPRSREAAAART